MRRDLASRVLNRLPLVSRSRAGERDRDGDDRERAGWAALGRHVAFATERTMEQDAAVGFRPLADIALQALSPAVNAPTTAAQVIDELHDLLRRLVTAPPPGDGYRDDDGQLRLVIPQYSIGDYLDLAVAGIWAEPPLTDSDAVFWVSVTSHGL